jgi:hypothetical protein
MTGPSSVSDGERDRRLLAEQEAIHVGVARIVFAWAKIENWMVLLLQRILKHESHEIASAIYFTPAALEVRIKLVNAALEALVARKAVGTPLLKEWKTILNTLNRLRKTRNKIAHGDITVFHPIGGPPPVARLTPPMMVNQDEAIQEWVRTRKLPGLGSNELTNSVNALMQVEKRIIRFWNFVDLIHEDAHATLLQKLGEVADENRSQPAPDSQTPPEPESQPPPSEE